MTPVAQVSQQTGRTERLPALARPFHGNGRPRVPATQAQAREQTAAFRRRCEDALAIYRVAKQELELARDELAFVLDVARGEFVAVEEQPYAVGSNGTWRVGPIPYSLTDAGREAIGAPFAEPEPFAGKTVDAWLP